MMAQPVPHQSPDKKRVKVYELRNNDWFDRGTGFCSTTLVQVKDSNQKEARLLVESEDHPERLLLETTITRQEGFQIQQDTLIVWTENPTPNGGNGGNGGTDMALSFQEAEGCAAIWKFVSSVQQSFEPAGVGGDDSYSEDATMDAINAITLPAAELGNLARIDNDMRAMSAYGNSRDTLAKFIMADDYIQKLIPLVEMAEDLESISDLHLLCNIMKTILLLNDTSIMEHAVSDECVLGVVGALEYDPDFPTHKANHRTWLSNQGRFKEVVPLGDDQILRKIHQTYRLQYLKDVVLARILDDPTYSVLNSIIFFNQVEIVQYVSANSKLLTELFGIFDQAKNPEPDAKRQKDAVGFIQQCCAIAKSLQPPARQNLYTNFLNEGLTRVILYGIRQPDVTVRIGAAEILISIIDHDPNLIRMTMYRQVSNNESPLTTSLIDLLLVEVDLGVKCHISDALKILLDPVLSPEQLRANGERPGMPRLLSGAFEPQQDMFIERFYEEAAHKLCKPLIDLEGCSEIVLTTQQASMFSYLVDLVSYLIRIHHERSMFFIEQNNITSRVAQLLNSREKYIQLVAIRFFRQLSFLSSSPTATGEFYKRHLAEKGVLGPVLDLLIKTLPRDNLLSSACLELFENLKKDSHNLPSLKYLAENHREKLVSLSYLDTFRDMLFIYDRVQNGPTSMDFFPDTDDDTPQRSIKPNTRFMEQLTVDPVEEEYMNSVDDEDEDREKTGEKTPATNGASTPRLLVDYTSDEDGDENADPEEAASRTTPDGAEGDEAATTPKSTTTSAPPERISEKRRREDEEEDAFGSLMQDKKRRNSANANAALPGVTRPRRTSTSHSRGSTPKKIQISLSATLKARTEAADGGS